ncbi:pyridoxamine 5-phosphate oxidase [Veronia nyctiphanis]|uniref:Pyridoxamine 5-phosphate oxidase n=1 Tax=Veronia nyctiphanis TaxID=1278244 RepID=A0A4Q0YWI1_9GAMM|nr:DUF3283 family protein [Veronia nyctiphanis]RXJ74624.1 pyridoxamine 5-phosphate oxidase [Veronia nyctiphanis]
MSQNLALLPPDKKQFIEIDKQAAYAVWRIKNGMADNTLLSEELRTLKGMAQQEHFQNSVAKYQQIMGM